jgi:hypothetical protein
VIRNLIGNSVSLVGSRLVQATPKKLADQFFAAFSTSFKREKITNSALRRRPRRLKICAEAAP